MLRDPEEARDVAQEAFLRAYQAWVRFDGVDPRAWLYTIGLRLAPGSAAVASSGRMVTVHRT